MTGFRSRSFNAITAQVVMILLTYTLRQWQLWKFVEETLANLTPESLVQQLNLRQQWVVIYLGYAYTQMPPLPYLEPRFTPRAIPRDEPPPELKSEVDNEFRQAILAMLPAAMISLPPACVTAPWWLAQVAHETGHHLQHELGLLAPFQQALQSAAAAHLPAGAAEDLAAKWLLWNQEIFADLHSILCLGPAAPCSLSEAELTSDSIVDGYGPYPATVVRLELMRQGLRHLKLSDADALGEAMAERFDETSKHLPATTADVFKMARPTACAALLQTQRGGNLAQQWREVGLEARVHPSPAEAERLSDRALAGEVSALARAGLRPEAALLDRFWQSVSQRPDPAQGAALEAVTGLAEGLPREARADLLRPGLALDWFAGLRTGRWLTGLAAALVYRCFLLTGSPFSLRASPILNQLRDACLDAEQPGPEGATDSPAPSDWRVPTRLAERVRLELLSLLEAAQNPASLRRSSLGPAPRQLGDCETGRLANRSPTSVGAGPLARGCPGPCRPARQPVVAQQAHRTAPSHAAFARGNGAAHRRARGVLPLLAAG